MKSNDLELLACPFCGGNKLSRSTDHGDERIGYNITHTIRCNACGCSQSASSKKDKNGWCVEGSEGPSGRAVIAWNTRTPAPTIVDLANADADGYRNGRASVVVELPKRCTDLRYHSEYIRGQANMLEDCKEAIIAAGGTVRE